ncbi:MAG: carbohydrate-binding protein [Chthoniobacterales bacterium]
MAESYTNPLVYGADPAVVDGLDGKYYLFTTKGFGTQRYSSTDLVNWGEKEDRAYAGSKKRKGWAPTHWNYDDTWHMFTVGAHTTSDSLGTSFELTPKEKGVGFDPMYFGLIDEKHHMFIGGTAVMNQLILMDDPDNETDGGNTVFYYWPAYYTNIFEGPWVHEHEGTYYLMTSIENAKGVGYRLAYATADNPRGPWTFQTLEKDDAFLRQSYSEEIWGPGHHCMIGDSNGTQWVYYQQKEDTGSNWDRKIAVDPMWFDESGRIHMRPTRGVSRPGPGSALSEIWPTVSASSQIEAETYAGSAYTTLNNGGSGDVVTFTDAGGFLAFRNVDFGAGKDGFSVTLSCEESGTMPSSLAIRLGGVDEPIVGTLAVSETDGFVQLSGKLNQTVTGTHDVFLHGHGSNLKGVPFLLDHFTFEETGAGSVNLPPVCEDETVMTPIDQPIVVAVLDNDSDPEGQTLTVTGVGRAGQNANNESFKGGSLSIDGNLVTYTPSGSYWGTDAFFYAVRDSEGLHSRGRVTVEVLPLTDIQTVGDDGIMVVEAEDFAESLQMDDTVVFYTENTQAGLVGDGYVTTPDNGLGRIGKPCRLTYTLHLPSEKRGIYTLWARVLSPSGDSNSSQFSFSRRAMEHGTEDAHRLIPLEKQASGEWVWIKEWAHLSLTEGTYKMSLWRDYDGQLIDRFLLSDDPEYNPNEVNGGLGPLDGEPNSAPNADAGLDQTVIDSGVVGTESVVLDGSQSSDADGSIVSFLWSAAGNPGGEGETPTVDLAIGTHAIDLLVTDDLGATGTDFVTVTVEAGDGSGNGWTLDTQVEAEFASGGPGVTTSGGKLSDIQNGEWVRYNGFQFGAGAGRFDISAASPSAGRQVELRLGAVDGTVIGTVEIGATGSFDSYVTFSTALNPVPTGEQDLYLVFLGEGSGPLMDVDWIELLAAGAETPNYLGEHVPGSPPDVEMAEGMFSIVFARDPSVTDRIMIPQVSFDLPADWKGGEDFIAETFLGTADDYRFYRATSLTPLSDSPAQFMRVKTEPILD